MAFIGFRRNVTDLVDTECKPRGRGFLGLLESGFLDARGQLPWKGSLCLRGEGNTSELSGRFEQTQNTGRHHLIQKIWGGGPRTCIYYKFPGAAGAPGCGGSPFENHRHRPTRGVGKNLLCCLSPT